jgi:phage tail sheath protein FI
VTTAYLTPGVYMEEVPAEGPIQPVGTSTPAFIGPASLGTVNVPTFVTTFDQFRQIFGVDPMDGFYLWYAVRGFFENGGGHAWIVRSSSGRPAHLDLMNGAPSGTDVALVIESRALGHPAPDITVQVDSSSLASAKAFMQTFQIVKAVGDTIQLAATPSLSASEAAARFRIGDKVHVEEGATSEQGVVASRAGDLLVLDHSLTNSFTASATVRLADLAAGDVVIRLDADAAKLGAGSIVDIKQDATTETAIVSSVAAERIDPATVTYRVTLTQPGLANGYLRDGSKEIDVTSREFTLTVAQGGSVQTRANLSMAPANPRYVGTVLGQQPFTLVDVHEPAIPSTAPPIQRQPAQLAATALDDGQADDPAALTLADYETALDTLRTVDDVNFVVTPDSQDVAIQLAVQEHCISLHDRVAIFDPPQGVTPLGPGANLVDLAGLLATQEAMSTIYYPWIELVRPADGKLIAVPPSGHVAGVWARADAERGVHKAPANYLLNGVVGVTTLIDDATQGPLNESGVNVLRVFPGQGRPVIWGARTLVFPKNEPPTKYINHRRLLLFLEESIEEGIRWAVFEPNNEVLWQKLKRVITAFLTAVWRDGALFGAKVEEAFYVKIDETNNTADDRASGRLNAEIGLNVAFPAEFIVVRIGLWQGGSTTTET